MDQTVKSYTQETIPFINSYRVVSGRFLPKKGGILKRVRNVLLFYLKVDLKFRHWTRVLVRGICRKHEKFYESLGISKGSIRINGVTH